MMQESNNRPTVSIVVVTYNSSKYVLDTLESIKNQTYPHLSLIISDDCSTDKTIMLCEKWVDKNKDRFIETIILESSTNTGVSANGNRGERACKTKWVKQVAGDDILLPSCIEENVSYVGKHPETIYLFSMYEDFRKKRGDLFSHHDYSFFFLTPSEQLRCLIFNRNYIGALTLFYNVEKTRELSLYNDERIPMMEDWPKWINALKKGITFCFLEKTTMLWRYHQESISSSHTESPIYRESKLKFYYLYQRPAFVAKFGEEKTLEAEINERMHEFRQYYECRRLMVVRIVFSFRMIWKRILKLI